MQQQPEEKYYLNRSFILLCISSLLFFSSFNMLLGELPSYLRNLGGEEYLGLIIALFTLAAGISRPFSGKLTDNIGRIPVMMIGAIVSCLSSLCYILIPFVSGFLFLRFFHGFSTGFKPTGTTAYVADIVPSHKRGEAIGIQGLFGTCGMALGPFVGSEIALHFSLDVMFYCSSFMALLSVIILTGMKETVKNKKAFSFKLLRLKKSEIIDPYVIKPTVVTFLTLYSFGTALTVIPDLSEEIGIRNKSTFFLVFTLFSALIRFTAGRWSDFYGRVRMLRIANGLLALSLILIAFTTTATELYIYAAIFGIGAGINFPSLMSWVIDLSHPDHRGRAVSTMFIALEAGIFAGALASGYIYSNHHENLKATFLVSAGMNVLSLLFLFVMVSKKDQSHIH